MSNQHPILFLIPQTQLDEKFSADVEGGYRKKSTLRRNKFVKGLYIEFLQAKAEFGGCSYGMHFELKIFKESPTANSVPKTFWNDWHLSRFLNYVKLKALREEKAFKPYVR